MPDTPVTPGTQESVDKSTSAPTAATARTAPDGSHPEDPDGELFDDHEDSVVHRQSQLSRSAALRARDVSRPTEADEQAARAVQAAPTPARDVGRRQRRRS
jgi:hypothetical protein